MDISGLLGRKIRVYSGKRGKFGSVFRKKSAIIDKGEKLLVYLDPSFQSGSMLGCLAPDALSLATPTFFPLALRLGSRTCELKK